jgi:hypothetical protein
MHSHFHSLSQSLIFLSLLSFSLSPLSALTDPGARRSATSTRRWSPMRARSLSSYSCGSCTAYRFSTSTTGPTRFGSRTVTLLACSVKTLLLFLLLRFQIRLLSCSFCLTSSVRYRHVLRAESRLLPPVARRVAAADGHAHHQVH